MSRVDKFNVLAQLMGALARELDGSPHQSIPKENVAPTMAILEAAVANDVFYPTYKWIMGNARSDALDYRVLGRKYKELFYQYTIGQTIQLSQAASLLRTFSHQGIDVMPVKGLLLSHQYYKDPLTRYSRDIDFLFRSKKDRSLAEKVLADAGYFVSEVAPLQTLFTKHVSRFSVHCETHNVPISLSYSYEYPTWYDLWSRSRAGNIMDCSVHLMRPEDALLVLCAHVVRNGTLSVKDFMDFMLIVRQLDSSGWNHLEQLSEIPLWQYIITLPLVLFSKIGEIFLSKDSIPPESANSLAARTAIRIETSSKLLSFLLREHGMPIDLRYVMRYFGYSETPLFVTCLLWNKGSEHSFLGRILSVFLEGCQSLTLARSKWMQGYAMNSVQSYLSTYLLHVARDYKRTVLATTRPH